MTEGSRVAIGFRAHSPDLPSLGVDENSFVNFQGFNGSTNCGPRRARELHRHGPARGLVVTFERVDDHQGGKRFTRAARKRPVPRARSPRLDCNGRGWRSTISKPTRTLVSGRSPGVHVGAGNRPGCCSRKTRSGYVVAWR